MSATIGPRGASERTGGTAGGGSMGELNTYEIAFLCGGPRRVAQTALLALVEGRRVRVSRAHRVEAVRARPDAPAQAAPDDPLQAALLERVPGTGTMLGPLLAAVAETPELQEIAAALRERGLLRGASRPTRKGKAARRVLAESPVTTDLARLAALGPGAVEDARMREILGTDDPKPIKLPRTKHRSNNLEASNLPDSQYNSF
ncbi:TIGR04222 domain-containing membrane protein [Actinomadura sp. NEAU-AAG7]|uniref:TIGR04222 domain-containing membrane protein n=1 Tax=Actinomadura sp. NEAU-AAG7 TaxID=2839640 RepID=UPI00254999F0|nr:TIGR04222 domain-containing membrane protein [Actinomadura sp. NEAU-AAG7]